MNEYEKLYYRDYLKKESIRLTMWVLRAWGDLCTTDFTEVFWAGCN